MSNADQLTVGLHCVFKLKLHFAHPADSHLDVDDVLERGWAFVLAGNGDDRGEDVFRLDFVESAAQLVEPVDTRLFHETDIVGMMRHAHAVAFVIFHFVLVGVH